MSEQMFAITAAERTIIQETLAHYGSLVGWADKVVTIHGTGDERHLSLVEHLSKHREALRNASSINLREMEQPAPQEKVELPENMLPAAIYEKESE